MGDFEAYVNGAARAEHDHIIDEAESIGVFCVPTMVFNGELFWGRRPYSASDRTDSRAGNEKDRIGQPALIYVAAPVLSGARG